MRTSDAIGTVIVLAPAKINLYLGIHTEKDERGYHRVDSVMAALSLADTVVIDPADELSVRTDPDVGVPMEQNTGYRAAAELARTFGRDAGARITIHKRIPLQAGLGGPSADAAAVLVGLCELWGIDVQDERVDKVARGIGADVPFFLHGSLAYLDGAGDCLRERFEPFAGKPVVLVKPEDAGVSAGAAYARFDEDPQTLPPLEPVLDALRTHRYDDLCTCIANNLAPASCALEPKIADVLTWLEGKDGSCASLMSGSGACSFALCDSIESARVLAEKAQKERGWWACATTMEKSGATIIKR